MTFTAAFCMETIFEMASSNNILCDLGAFAVKKLFN